MTDKFEEKEIEFPESAFVACPKAEYALVRIKQRCIDCVHFAGLYDREKVKGPAPLTFYKKYMVYCSHPVVREITEVQA